MTQITHHPSEALLLDCYHGHLADGPALIVATHVGLCAHCRESLRLFPAIGGVLLEDIETVELSSDALELAMARIERPIDPYPSDESAPVQRASRQPGAFLSRYNLPERLRARIPSRYWAAPGVWVAPVRRGHAGHSLAKSSAKTYLLGVAPGLVMPLHDHGGKEFTLVLHGGFSDADGNYDVGDFIERSPGEVHSPTIDAHEGCLSLITHTRSIRPKTLLGILLKPFARI